MAVSQYDFGLDELRNWGGSGDFRALLTDAAASYSFNAAQQFVSAVTASELGAAGYSRFTITGMTRTVDTGLHRITYDGDDPGFGSIANGFNVDSMIVYRFVTSDADSILVGYFPLVGGPIATDGSPFPVVIPAAGYFYTHG